MKELILNADDFGLSSGANRGIIQAWQQGVLTSTSIMVGGAGFQEAVALAKENPGLQVGLHLTLLQGRGVLGREGFPDIVDENGDFHNDPVQTGMRYFFLRSLRRKLAREIEAQLVACRDAGITPSHVDGHLNIHMHPVVFDILCRLMPRYGIQSFRVSRENLSANLKVDRKRLLGKLAESFIFDRLARRCLVRLDTLGIRYCTEVKGLYNSGRMTEEYLLNILETVGDGVTEIYFHPGCRPCPELDRWMPDYRHDEELGALTSPRVREKMAKLGIRLRNYRGEEKSYV